MRWILVVVLFACGAETPLRETCERTGDRCRLRDGLLGICTPVDCDTPPCLRCTPQH
ncbi:MAG: hypothetical protein AAGE52_40540 [Myxococcota bacterium]